MQVYCWWYKPVLKEPMLWILFADYLFTGLGLIAVGAFISNPLSSIWVCI